MKKLLLIFSLTVIGYNTYGMEEEPYESEKEREQPGTQITQHEKKIQKKLFKALVNGDTAGIEEALAQGACVNAKNDEYENGLTPMCLASSKGDLKVLELLHEHGADINIQTNNGMSPLHYAAHCGHMNIVKWLLDNKADINARTSFGELPIHWAAKTGRLDILDYLFSYTGTNSHRFLPDFGNILGRLFGGCQNGFDINAQDNHSWTLLHHAARGDCIDVIKWLLDHGAHINAGTRFGPHTPMHMAAYDGHLNAVKFLFERGANINLKDYHGHLPVDKAAEGGHIQMLTWFLDNGIDFQSHSTSLVLDAARGGHAQVLEWLFQRGADINASDEDGCMPAYWAASDDSIGALEWLFGHGSNMDIPNNSGTTPMTSILLNFDLAPECHAAECLAALWFLEHGYPGESLELKNIDTFKEYPLIYAVLQGKEEETSTLLATYEKDEQIRKQFNHAFLLMIAFRQETLIKQVLDTMMEKVSSQLLSFALEIAGLNDNLDLFIKLYAELRSRLHAQKLTNQEFLDSIQKVLYVLAIRCSERAVQYILERAIAYQEAPTLDIQGVVDRISQLLERSSLQAVQRVMLGQMRKLLINAGTIPQPGEIYGEESHKWLENLPSELWPLITIFLLNSRSRMTS